MKFKIQFVYQYFFRECRILLLTLLGWVSIYPSSKGSNLFLAPVKNKFNISLFNQSIFGYLASQGNSLKKVVPTKQNLCKGCGLESVYHVKSRVSKGIFFPRFLFSLFLQLDETRTQFINSHLTTVFLERYYLLKCKSTNK